MNKTDETWKRLINEYGHLIGCAYLNEQGNEEVFAGILLGDDDYYYFFTSDTGYRLYSCVAYIECYGLELVGSEYEQNKR